MQTFACMPFGKEAERGEARPLALTAVSLWGVTAFLLGLLDVEMAGPVTVLFALTVVVILLCILCEVTVVLFDALKFLVSPHMRADLGVLATRRADRAARMRRAGS